MFQNCLHIVCSKEHTHLNFWLWELKITNARWQRCLLPGAVTHGCRARWCFARGQVYRAKRLHIQLSSGDAPGCRSESLTLKLSSLLEKPNHPSIVVSFNLLLLFIVKAETETSHRLVHFSNAHDTGTGPGQSWEPGAQSGWATWVAGTRLLEPSPVASQSVH